MKIALLTKIHETEIASDMINLAHLRQPKRAGNKLKNGRYENSCPFVTAEKGWTETSGQKSRRRIKIVRLTTMKEKERTAGIRKYRPLETAQNGLKNNTKQRQI